MFETIVTAQTAGRIVAILDIAHTLDLAAAKEAGVNVERLLVSQPDTMPQAAEIAETLVRSGAIEMLVVLGKMSTRPLARVRECAARTGTEIVTIAAERAPEPLDGCSVRR